MWSANFYPKDMTLKATSCFSNFGDDISDISGTKLVRSNIHIEKLINATIRKN